MPKCYLAMQLSDGRERICRAVWHSEYHTQARHTVSRKLQVISFFSCVFLLLHCFTAAQAKEVRRVLVLSEVGPYYPAIALVDQGIHETLKQSPYEVELYREYLDTGLFPDPQAQREFLEWYIRKYRERRPDVIITVGPSPLKLMVGSSEPFFHDVPVVFCASWEDAAGRPKLGPQFTGIWEEMEPLKTLEAALGLQPGTEHVFVDGGTSPYDRSLKALVRERLHDYKAKLDIEYFPDLPMPELLARLRHLPDHSVVLHAGILRDAAGTQFIDATEAGPMVARAANAPVFTFSDVNVGHGEQGGDVISFVEDGKVAGGMAVRILGGKKPQDIPVVRGNTVYMFDWRAMNRWGLKERDLPPGSIVLNRQLSFWELYWRYVITGVFLLLAQALIILALLWQRARRRKAEAELRDSQMRFEGIVESAMDAVISIDEGQRIVIFNDAAEKIFGCPARDAIGSPVDRFIPERFREAHLKHVRHFDDSGITAQRTMGASRGLWGLRANGEEFPIEASISQTRTGGKKLFTVIVQDITERKAAEEALSSVSRRLIEAHEEERTWIARELHDDFNQRIALLAVNLEGLKRDLPGSNGQISCRINEVQEHVSDLGSDIQGLSRRLHSSKLEYLGLGAAAEGFCKELSAGQNVEIAFQSQAIPKNLPPEISLCLFRVLQEALQNAVKHSGARRFEVSLVGGMNEIELTVHDSGGGFDPEKAVDGLGLGLTSMRERLKIVDGHLSIDSKLQGGTTIHARVSLRPAVKSAVAGG